MNGTASIQFQNNSLVITGELNFATAVSLWNASQPLIKSHSDLHFDFSKVTTSNSAGLAVILEWIKYARRANKTIHFSHIPAQLHSIIAVADIENLISDRSSVPVS